MDKPNIADIESKLVKVNAQNLKGEDKIRARHYPEGVSLIMTYPNKDNDVLGKELTNEEAFLYLSKIEEGRLIFP